MAIYHFHHKILSRSTRNTVSCLAYRSGTLLKDQKTGKFFNYTAKAVASVHILLPPGAPEWARKWQRICAKNRRKGLQFLSNRIEATEKRRDAQVYRELEFALPLELSPAQNIFLANIFIQENCCAKGMIALNNFHFEYDPLTQEARPHCHSLLLMREATPEGFALKKNRSWNTRFYHQYLRQQYAVYQNFFLGVYGHTTTVDHRSYEERYLKIIPQLKKDKIKKDFYFFYKKRSFSSSLSIENSWLIPEVTVPPLHLFQGDLSSSFSCEEVWALEGNDFKKISILSSTHKNQGFQQTALQDLDYFQEFCFFNVLALLIIMIKRSKTPSP